MVSSPIASELAAPAKSFDFSKHPRRKIALKFCYSGWEYGGLAFQTVPTPLPTVENVLFDVLAKTRLIYPAAGFEGCGWEKCGRTDRGVSAAGQVISLWVRSALPAEDTSEAVAEEEAREVKEEAKADLENLGDELGSLMISDERPTNSSIRRRESRQEHDYLAMLNRLLPDTIRVIAWSPVSESFSARFSCTYRHYKYFFSSRNLDIALMQAGAARLMGSHDFRNLCKIDAQKQITIFRRTIMRATISSVDDEDTGMYVFDLVGTAFLYHQVRHIMAVLLLVGSGLEPPSIITKLMNVEPDVEAPSEEDGFEHYPVIDRKPEYQMADALPLMLWECGYDESELDWRISGQVDGGAIIRTELPAQLQGIHARSRVFEALDKHFLKAAEKHHPSNISPLPLRDTKDLDSLKEKPARILNVPLGGGTFKRTLKYVPLLERRRLDTAEVINGRWRLRDQKKKGNDNAVVDDGDE